jgi:DNA primase
VSTDRFDLGKVLKQIETEDFCEVASVDYRMTTGSSGTQVNVKECPRCGGKDWKVFLNAENGLGNCFHGSCVGEPGFNLFSFAKHQLGLSAKDTVNYFEDFARKRRWILGTARKVHSARPEQVQLKLPESVEIKQGQELIYLEGRGFDKDVAEHFGWTFCKKGVFAYKREDGEDSFQTYDDRIIVPIFDISGKPVTFQGRDITGKSLRKYMFPPGLPGTGRYLYGANKAKGVPNVIMNEGVFDVAATYIAFKEFSDIAAIGSFGKSLSGRIDTESMSEDQLSELIKLSKSGMKKLTIMWDGEVAAIHDACKTAEGLMRAGIETFIAILPRSKDPNEVSPEELRACYARALKATKSNIVRLRLKHTRT